MNSQEKNIRNFVKNLLKENYQEIDEANKGKQFNSYFEFTDFIIMKLGKFVLNDKGVRSVLTFSKERDIDKGYSYMYLYIYHNTIELIRFGSSFFEDNNA